MSFYATILFSHWQKDFCFSFLHCVSLCREILESLAFVGIQVLKEQRSFPFQHCFVCFFACLRQLLPFTAHITYHKLFFTGRCGKSWLIRIRGAPRGPRNTRAKRVKRRKGLCWVNGKFLSVSPPIYITTCPSTVQYLFSLPDSCFRRREAWWEKLEYQAYQDYE